MSDRAATRDFSDFEPPVGLNLLVGMEMLGDLMSEGMADCGIIAEDVAR